MGAHVTDKDKGWREMQRMIREATESKAPRVVVGITQAKGGEPAQGSPATVIEVATFNEFGTRDIPARSFIRETVDVYQKEIATFARKLAKNIIGGDVTSGVTLPDALALLGNFVKGKIVQRINSGIEPANAPSTIARKGSSKPLIRYGQLKGAIDYEVRDAGGGE